MAAPEEKGAAGEKDEKKNEKEEGGAAEVKLTPEEISNLGIATAAAAAVRYVPAKQGFGVVMSHDAIAQAVADVVTAQAGVRLSQAALARITRLDGTAGAQSAEAHESAARQAAVDAAALRLAEAKSSALFGQRPPWAGHDDSKMLAEVAEGHAKLLRVTFPLGVLTGPRAGQPARLAPRCGKPSATGGRRGRSGMLHSTPVSPDAVSSSRCSSTTDVGEGERVLIWAAGDKSEQGPSPASSSHPLP